VTSVLVAIRLLHTAIWAFFVACIVAIPILAVKRRLKCAVILTGVVLLECSVLTLNHGRCPLTNLAARYTHNRANNFDIYLPAWLARHNKGIFGTLFVGGELMVLWRWQQLRHRRGLPC
jgi:hypothetical protein